MICILPGSANEMTITRIIPKDRSIIFSGSSSAGDKLGPTFDLAGFVIPWELFRDCISTFTKMNSRKLHIEQGLQGKRTLFLFLNRS